MTWNFTCSTTETSTWAQAGRKFGELMDQATGGKVKVDVYEADRADRWKPVRGHPGADERRSGADFDAQQPDLFGI